MALQDLTPQLRTRLSRMERAVGWFVILATAMLVAGFVYYVYHTAQRKGWFLKKITYQTCVSSGAGLKLGDPVKLMGFDVGEITAIIPNDPREYYNITIRFCVKVDQYNYQGYIWSDSKVKVNAGDLLGNRYLEITKGLEGLPTVLQSTNSQLLGILQSSKFVGDRLETLVKEGRSKSAALAYLNIEAREHPDDFYTTDFRDSIYFLEPLESPAVTERLDKLVSEIEVALPNILNLTNQISGVLTNSYELASNLNALATSAYPVVSNLHAISSQLNGAGSLGQWLFPTNVHAALAGSLQTVDTQLPALFDRINQSLENLANITSNLNAQVQANTNMLGGLSRAIVDTDNFVQGLKRHWLLRSAFKSERTNTPPMAPKDILRSPREEGSR